MFALLLGAAAIYLVLGDLREAVVLAIFASTSVLIAVVQETRTERVLESLRDLTSPRALVIRDGAEKRIAGAEVVRGDLVDPRRGRPRAGRRDRARPPMICNAMNRCSRARPCRCARLPLRKLRRPARPGGDDLPYVYSGSLVVRGHGRAEVTATGRAARSARSALRLRGSIPSRRGCGSRRGAWSAILPP